MNKVKKFLYSQKAAPYVFILPFVLTVILFWVFPINRWSTKYFKVVSWTISMGIWLLCMIVFPLFFLKPGSTAAPIIMTSILVVGLNALYQVIYAMISDCVEVDELMSGAAFETGGERDYFR